MPRELKICHELFEFDAGVRLHFPVFCGVDEAGRGPLAGDVYAAAVILPPDIEIAGLNDSKKLSEKRREELAPVIQEKALAYCIASATVEEIERINILQAALLAMHRAVEGLPVVPDYVLTDGNQPPVVPMPVGTLVRDPRALQQHRCLPRQRVMPRCGSLTKNIRNTALQSTRATAQRRIMRRSMPTAPVRRTGRPS